jgi:FkbM family methyltransferase
LRGLRAQSREPLAFAENDPAKWGTRIEGIPVLSLPDAVARYNDRAAFVITVWSWNNPQTALRRQLAQLDAQRVVHAGVLFRRWPETFLPYYALDRPEHLLKAEPLIRSVASLWTEDSRREYAAQLHWRAFLDFELLQPVAEEMYFPNFLAWQPGEVFVDCGAYDGDTVARVFELQGGNIERIIALEPDRLNCERLRSYRNLLPREQRERLRLHDVAAGGRNGCVSFTSTGDMNAAIGEGPDRVQCVRLDDLLQDERPTYIKMDIEGAELDALEGARQVIRQHRPVLAVCVYHRQDHLWRVPAFIREMVKDYRFFLRPHKPDGWDLVCYAVPVERVR